MPNTRTTKNNHMEIFNCVLLTGTPGYAWRIKKKFSKAQKSDEKAFSCKNIRNPIKPKNKPFWCKIGQQFLFQGKQCVIITCYEPINITREILYLKFKYNVETETLYSEITVNSHLIEKTLTGNSLV